MINKTPKKPNKIAIILLKKNFSFKNNIASNVAKMGATLPIAETSANDEINRALNQKYRAKALIADLTKCTCIFFV